MTLDLCRNLKLLCFILIVKFTLICVATSDNEQRPQQNDEKRTESQKISEKLIAEHGGQMPTNELFISRGVELLNSLNRYHGGRELQNQQQQQPNEEHFPSDSHVQQRQQPLPFNINVPDLNEPDFSEVPTSMSSEVEVGLNPSLPRDIALHHQQKTEESSTGASENEPAKKQFTFDLNEFPPPDLVSSPPLPQQQTARNLPTESIENNLNSPAAAENDQMAGEIMQDGGNKANAEGQQLCAENSVLEPQKEREERESAKRVENSLGFNSSPTAAVVHPKQHQQQQQQQQTVVNLSQGNLEKNAATTVNENADRFSREYKKRFERGESSTATFPPPLLRPILSSAGEFFPGEFERQTADNRNVNEKIGESSVGASVYNPVQRTASERGQQHNSLEIGSSSASQKLDKFRESITQILRLLAERRTLTRTNTTDNTLHHRRGKRPISAVDEELETASNNPETEVNSIATKIRTSSRNKRQKKCICCSKLGTIETLMI